jgi:hypothetical protein
MTKLDIRAKAESLQNMIDLTTRFTLTPTSYPYAIGLDDLAKRAVELIKILKRYNLNPDNVTRSTYSTIDITYGESVVTLEIGDYYYYLINSVALIESINPADHDQLDSDFVALHIMDDYFNDLDDDNY